MTKVTSDPLHTAPGVHPGARWWKVDFHAHSPASFDFGGVEGSRSETKPSYREWLLAYMIAGIDAIVVTDHNSHEGISKARATYEALQDERPDGFRPIAIFAGVELTVEGGWHLLAVFDVDTDPDVVNGLLHTSGYRGERGESNATTEKAFGQVVEEIIKHGGIAIPAHADENKGVFKHDMRSVDPLFGDGKILAVEATGEITFPSALQAGCVRVLGSDAHHLDDSDCPPEAKANAKYPGSHYTWVKMASPSLAGIRHAISDGSASVVPTVGPVPDRNLFEHDIVEKIIIRQGADEAVYEFGPWLNAVIGGRGVGKSTLIEVARLVLGRSKDLPKRLQKDLEWFSPEQNGRSTPRFWSNDTVLTVHIRRADKRYRTVWSGVTQTSTIESLQDDQWVGEQGAPRDRFPTLVNSQKQIYELAKDPRGLLNMIDEQSDVRIHEWTDEFNRLRTRYRTLRGELVEVEAEIAHEDRLRGELSDVEAKLSYLTQQAESPQMLELEEELRAQRSLSMFEEQAEEFENALSRLVEDHSGLTSVAEEEVQNVWEKEHQRRDTIATSLAAVSDVLDTVRASRTEWASVRDASPRLVRIRTLEESLGISTTSDPPDDLTAARTAEIVQMRGAKGAIEAGLAKIDALKERHARLHQESSELLDALADHRSEITRRRRDVANRISGEMLRVNVHEQADAAALEAELRRITRKETGFDSAFGETGMASLLEHPFSPGRVESVKRLKGFLKTMHDQGRDALNQDGIGRLDIDARFYAGLQDIERGSFESDVDLWFPEDGLQVKYKGSDGKMRPIDEGSPGQRTAALLAALLSLGSDPLLLDQPEDDLDNKLITSLVVESLRRIKTQRQVIVVTHNANIVVNGDAEHVTTLTHGPVPKTAVAGSMHEGAVKDMVCEVMEGGRTALQSRYSRLAALRRSE